MNLNTFCTVEYNWYTLKLNRVGHGYSWGKDHLTPNPTRKFFGKQYNRGRSNTIAAPCSIVDFCVLKSYRSISTSGLRPWLLMHLIHYTRYTRGICNVIAFFLQKSYINHVDIWGEKEVWQINILLKFFSKMIGIPNKWLP